MGYAINTNHLPCIRDYEQASQRERSTTPIRGKTIKPLGERRAQHMQILRLNEGTELEAIACRLYNTDCVTYYKDGRIHLQHGGYITPSTTKFIDRVLYGGRVEQRDNCLLFSHGGGAYRIPKEGLWIGKDGQLSNVEPFKVHTVNRQGKKQVRARYAPFIKYITSMIKLMDTHMTREEYYAASGSPIKLHLPENDELETWAALLPAWRVGAALITWDSSQQGYTYVIHLPQLKRNFAYAMALKHRDEIFNETVLPLGKYKNDPYKKFFK